VTRLLSFGVNCDRSTQRMAWRLRIFYFLLVLGTICEALTMAIPIIFGTIVVTGTLVYLVTALAPREPF
jgi:hypothetical protein